MGRPANLAIRLLVEGNEKASAEINKLQQDFDQLDKSLTQFSKSLLIGGAVEGLAAALAPVATAAAAAGAALGGLGVAVLPQFTEITAAAKTLELAQKQQAEGSKAYASTMALYNEQIAKMPPATRAAASAMADLKTGFQKWSDALAPETMPLFTKAIEGLREALPALTPLVDAAVKALTPFVQDFEDAARTGAIERFSKKLADIAGPVLSNLLGALKNFGAGFGNVMLALGKPAEDFSAKLVDWGVKFRALTGPTADNASGLQHFADVAGQAGAALEPLIAAILHVVTNSGPLVGLTLQLANAFSAMVLAIPTPALQILLPLIIGVTGAIKLFTIATAAAEVTMIALDVAMDANVVGILVVAFAALAAGVIYLWNHCEIFRKTLLTVWDVVKTGIQIYLTPLRLAFDAVRAAIGFVIDKGGDLMSWLDSKLHVPDVLGALGRGFDAIRDAIGNVISKVEDLIKKLGSIGKSAIDWIPGLGFFSAEGRNAPTGYGYAPRAGGDGVRALISASPIALSISIDGQQLQARISRSISTAMNRDGARLAAGGWA